MVIDPLHGEGGLHFWLVIVLFTVKEGACVIAKVCEVTQLFPSVTEILYVPVISPLAVDDAAALVNETPPVQVNPKVGVPAAVTVAPPVFPPKQATDEVLTLTVGPDGLTRETTALVVHDPSEIIAV
jgi:hypothetical protein